MWKSWRSAAWCFLWCEMRCSLRRYIIPPNLAIRLAKQYCIWYQRGTSRFSWTGLMLPKYLLLFVLYLFLSMKCISRGFTGRSLNSGKYLVKRTFFSCSLDTQHQQKYPRSPTTTHFNIQPNDTTFARQYTPERYIQLDKKPHLPKRFCATSPVP